jgi:toxin-antitoxin system PIN domain toxin
MFVVDTNVLVYGADPDSEFHQICRRRLQEWCSGSSPWYLSWPICYEFLRLSTHPNVFRKPWPITAGWRFIETILNSAGAGFLLPTGRHAAVLREVLAEVRNLRGNILHDAHTAVLMREHGIRQIYTRDTDFHRFPFLTVIDPTV